MQRSGIRERPSDYRKKSRHSVMYRIPDSIAFHPGYAGYLLLQHPSFHCQNIPSKNNLSAISILAENQPTVVRELATELRRVEKNSREPDYAPISTSHIASQVRSTSRSSIA